MMTFCGLHIEKANSVLSTLEVKLLEIHFGKSRKRIHVTEIPNKNCCFTWEALSGVISTKTKIQKIKAAFDTCFQSQHQQPQQEPGIQ